MGKRFTRKLSKYHRINPYDEYITKLHILLNRIDVEKDAIKSDVRITDSNIGLFHYYADGLFGKLPESLYDKSVEFIMSRISTFQSVESKYVKITNYQNNKHSIQEILPKTIKYGIQDAGTSPTSFQSSIELVVTPGSYIDRCSRSNSSTKFGFNFNLTRNDFKILGFPIFYNMKPTLNSTTDYCKITFEEAFNTKTVEVEFNNKFEAIRGDVDYFMGNHTKNRMFNQHKVNNESGYKFIILKELGDTLQAYYGVKFCSTNNVDKNSICLFTNDSNLSLRCQILFLPVLFHVNCEKIHKNFYYNPVMNTIQKDFVNMWKSNVVENNKDVIKSINAVIAQQSFALSNGKIIHFASNPVIKTILHKLIHEIVHFTKLFLETTITFTHPEHFRRYSHLFQALHVFNGITLNNCVKFLFMEHSTSKPEFQTSLNQLFEVIGHSGGGDIDDNIQYDISECDYIDSLEPDKEYESRIYTQHELYTQLSAKYPELSINHICLIVDSIHNMLYHYFGYMGESTCHPEFCKHVIDLYDSNSLQMPLEDFEVQYKIWHESVRDKSDESYLWEKIFVGQVDYDISYMIESLSKALHKYNVMSMTTYKHSNTHKTVKVVGRISSTRKTRKMR